MFEVDHCNCEGIHRKAVARWRIEHPETRELPYRDVIEMVNRTKIDRQAQLTGDHFRNPGDMRYAIYHRRLFDDNRYLRHNNGRQPQEMQIATPDGDVSFDLTFIPTLDYSPLPVKSSDLRGRAWDLFIKLAQQGLDETFLLKAVYDTRSLQPFFNPIYTAAGRLMPYFDPLCGDCPALKNGNCIPRATRFPNYADFLTKADGLVEIQRNLIFNPRD